MGFFSEKPKPTEVDGKEKIDEGRRDFLKRGAGLAAGAAAIATVGAPKSAEAALPTDEKLNYTKYPKCRH